MKWFSIATLLLLVAAGCSRRESPSPVQTAVRSGPPTIAAASYPLAYFAERLAKGLATVLFPVPAGEDPAFWEPGEKEIAALQLADLILLNGAGYEHWLLTATLPEEKMTDTSRAFAAAYLKRADTVTHSHGPGGAHEHGAIEFTTWLDPRLAARQADAVRLALARVLPQAAATLEANGRSLAADLESMDRELERAAKAWGARPLLASHPVYGYLARRYGLKLESVHWEPGEAPAEDEWPKLEQLLKKHPAPAMLWEDEPLPATRDRLKALGVACVVFRPCGNRPPAGDYLTEMRANALRLDQAAAAAQHVSAQASP